MANDLDSVTPIITRYLSSLRNANIRFEKVYLFGSYAKGTATPDSDIDLAIISSGFVGDRFEDRRKLVPLRRNVDLRIEPMPFRPEDFNDKDPLAIEIRLNGIEIN